MMTCQQTSLVRGSGVSVLSWVTCRIDRANFHVEKIGGNPHGEDFRDGDGWIGSSEYDGGGGPFHVPLLHADAHTACAAAMLEYQRQYRCDTMRQASCHHPNQSGQMGVETSAWPPDPQLWISLLPF